MLRSLVVGISQLEAPRDQKEKKESNCSIYSLNILLMMSSYLMNKRGGWNQTNKKTFALLKNISPLSPSLPLPLPFSFSSSSQPTFRSTKISPSLKASGYWFTHFLQHVFFCSEHGIPNPMPLSYTFRLNYLSQKMTPPFGWAHNWW